MSKNKNQWPFIVIEALDAGGSQTQTNELVKRLQKEGCEPLQLHFPQEDRATGKFIYEKFLNSHNQPRLSAREQVLIYIQDFFSRKEDIEHTLQETLVVSDRFYTSTMAYQTAGLAAAARRQLLRWIAYLADGLPQPELVIFLDTLPEVSLRHLRNQPKNYHEKLPKLKTFRKSYLALAREKKWVVVNSMTGNKQRPIQDIHEEIWQHVKKLL